MNCAGYSGVITASLVEIVSIGLASLERMSERDHEPPEQNSQLAPGDGALFAL
jgi:hypothetical protein